MKQGFVRWVKNVAVLGSAALCLWCAAGEFQSWARREGDDALPVSYTHLRAHET